MRVLADKNVAIQVTRMLNEYSSQHLVEHLATHYPDKIDDVDWIPIVSRWEPRPIILCGDGRILNRPSEVATLRRSGLSWFILTSRWTNLNFDDLAWKSVQAFGEIIKVARATKVPTVYEVCVRNARDIRTVGPTDSASRNRGKRVTGKRAPRRQ